MAVVIPVKFAFASRDLWFDQAGSDAQEGDHVICSTERGTEIGLATGEPKEMAPDDLARRIGNAKLKPVLRVATDADLDRAHELAIQGEAAMPAFRRMVSESGLDMKPVGVEYLFGGEKAVCYFAAEERVDFRQLVRELSRELRQRIDMRQIGVREEAAVVGGFGHCGQELCCARIGLSFEPVSIRMAKEQDLPLTSNKISGACGRLMCCLRYEFEAYRDFKGRAPKRNAVIDTPLGKAKVVEYDTPKEQLALRIENGKLVRIPLAEMVASEAAVKKSEELKCACRPDTVVRESLEKLNSPDVQMALAELDRKLGVVEPEEPDPSDIFADTSKPRKRRRRGGHGAQGAQDGPAEQGGKDSKQIKARAAGAGSRKPAKHRAASTAQADVSGEQTRTRRRRRRSGGEQTAVPASQPTKPQANTTTDQSKAAAPARRRRHRSAAAATQAKAQPQARTQSQTQTPVAEGAPRRRRPGDKGGVSAQQQAAQQQAAQQQQAQSKPRRRRRRNNNASSGANPNSAAS